MQLEIYQWLVPIIGIFYITRTFIQFKRSKRSLNSTIVWVVFWLTIMLLAVIPNEISFKIAHMLGFKSNINAVIFVALGLLFLFVFYLSALVEKLERQLTQLVRTMALKEKEEEEKAKKKKV